MPKLTSADLHYTDYSAKAVPGDDPKKTKEDADRFSRHEKYEVLDFLNSLTGSNGTDLPTRTRLIVEWMLHEKLPSDVQGRSKVMAWVVNNFQTLSAQYPR